MFVTELFKTKDPLLEAAMNPTSFSAAIAAGGDKKVVVGFEFEVCVPKATSDAAESVGLPTAIEPFFSQMNDDWAESLYLPGWQGGSDRNSLSRFFSLHSPAEYNGKTFNDLSKLLLYWQNLTFKRINEEILVANSCGLNPAQMEKLKQKIAMQRDFLRPTPRQKFVIIRNFAYEHGHLGRAPVALKQLNLRTLEVVNYTKSATKFFEDVVGDSSPEEVFSTLNYDLIPLLRFLNLIPEERINSRSEDTYIRAMTALKKPLEDNFGAVTVFSSYHQRDKLPNVWYIEPDGSLSPNDYDGAVEVVTPPLPVGEAVAALKTFYSIAKQLNLYTSADNHTGLHINVSIPETLDVLKLAVFLGDAYVLKEFKRTNNRYATSVMKSLRNSDSSASKMPKVGEVPASRTMDVFAPLQRLAKDISDDHFASINFNGTYVSFRHAGGDYLNNYTQVINVVGRFVRAMIIASDPNMYRNEYLSKLTKIIKPVATKISPIAAITQIRTAPITAVMYAAGALTDTASAADVKAGVDARFYGHAFLTLPNSTETFKQFIQDVPRGVLKNSSLVAMLANAATSTVMLQPEPGSYEISRFGTPFAYSIPNSESKMGVVVVLAKEFAPGTPEHSLLLRYKILQYKKKLSDQRSRP